MRRLFYIVPLLLLFVGVPEWALATTYWYRPGFDSVRTPLTYGTGTGLSKANAKAGFATINAGMDTFAPDDIICLSDETYYGEQLDYQKNAMSGTAGHPITIKGCDAVVSRDGHTSTGKARFWSASDLTGNLSYTAAKAQINNATYAWSTVSTDLYKKRIDTRPVVLWEDETWLEPRNVDQLTEAEIIATLPAGTWGNKNNGDGTFRLYYHATSAAKSPTLATIRCNAIPLDITSLFIVVANYITVQDIEFWGHGQLLNQYPGNFANASHLILERHRYYHNMVGPAIRNGTGVFTSDVLIKDVDAVHNEGVGLLIRGAANGGIADLTINGGNFSYTNGFYYTGTYIEGTDGDGIGIGWAGGAHSNFVIKNATMEQNFNYGVFYGTNVPMSMQNMTLASLRMDKNRRGCFSEGTDDAVRGTLLISGVVCTRSQDFTGTTLYGTYTGTPPGTKPPVLAKDWPLPNPSPALAFAWNSPTPRDIILKNVTMTGNKNRERIYLLDDTNNHYHLSNIVFWNNPGSATNDNGDIFKLDNGVTHLDANDTFDHIYFSSMPNQNRVILRDNTSATLYKYNSTSDKSAVTAFLTGTNIVYDTEPLLTSTQLSLKINPAPKPLAITSPAGSSLPNAKVGRNYSTTLKGSGGTLPYTWSITPALPTGLLLNTSTGAITGKPAQGTIGIHFLTITLQDSSLPTNQSTSKPVTLTVLP